MKTNYVIASWGGCRRNFIETGETPLNFLKFHLSRLRELKHSLDQITIISPRDPGESAEYTQYLDNMAITEAEGLPPIVVIRRNDNHGVSYGSYREAYFRWRDEFEYWFFIEDDYCFNVDHFDDIFKEQFHHQGWLIAGHIECGLTSTTVLNKLCRHFGNNIPLGNNVLEGNQVRWAANFPEAGLLREDILQKIPYAANFFNSCRNLFCYGSGPEILVSIPSLLNPNLNRIPS